VTFALLLLAPALAAAQPMNKCVDDKKQVTYSNFPCEKQGLKSAGTVTQDRVTSMPFNEPPKSSAPRKDKEPLKQMTPREREEQESERGSLQIKPNIPQPSSK
jgi:hypothetical protein